MALRDADGEVFARYIYSEYGVLKDLRINATALIDEPLAAQIAHNQPLRYAGYVYDEYSQMYYCAQRYYDPATQVFVSLDPARADGERSGYLYCKGDPVNATDPSGLWGKSRHSSITYQCAKDVGIRDYAAHNLADGARSTDDPPNDAVMSPMYHFNAWWWGADWSKKPKTAIYGLVSGGDTRNTHYKLYRSEAIRIIKGHSLKNKTTATKNASYTYGFALHMIQDAYAHGNIAPINHQLPIIYKNKWDDYSKNYGKRRTRMIKFSKKKLRKFKKDARG